jgi:GAF domain-containing protein
MKRRSRVRSKLPKARRRQAAAKRGNAAVRRRRSSTGDQKTEVARLARERDEAQERFSATFEVLKVISQSAGELEPVFRAMLENATRICEATSGLLVRAESDGFRVVESSHQRADIEEMKHRTFRFGPSTPIGRAIRTRQIVHVANLSEDRAYLEREPLAVWAVEQAKVRTVLVIPMLKGEELIGVFGLEREEVKPFTDKQIALVQTFAAQAVIAIENTRLLNELRQRTDDLTESLEQQTATADVLRVISSSPGELTPVFTTILDKALDLCEAAFGFVTTYDGERFQRAAERGVPDTLAAYFCTGMDQPRPGDAHWRLLAGEGLIHNLDQMDEEAYRLGNPLRRATVDLGGARSALVVALRKDGALLGALTVYRKEVRPFTDKQIALVQNFAAQAVIAIENARLLNELRESLERQTATADVLRIISSSPGDLQPVFSAMLESAARLCDASFGNIFRWEDDALRLVATYNTPAAFVEARRHLPLRRDQNNPIGEMLAAKTVLHVHDLAADERYINRRDPNVIAAVEHGGIRTFLAVPMLKDNELIGALIVYRQEVRPFSDKQIELVKNFAAQAVIAIENARLLSELRESLQQQTATSEVLGVISSSPGELDQVFQTMLENATRICEAELGMLWRAEGDGFRAVSMHGVPPDLAVMRRDRAFRFDPKTPLGRVAQLKRLTHFADARKEPAYIEGLQPFKEFVDVFGARTMLIAPMLKEDALIGVIAIYRKEVRLSRLRWCRTLPLRPSSRSRIHGCSTSCGNHWNSRRRRQRCCASSAHRRAR